VTETSAQGAPILAALSSRLISHLASWPRSLQTALEEYLELGRIGDAGHSSTGPKVSAEDPFWLRLPNLLAQKYHGQGFEGGQAISWLADLLWGQWCLFLSFRLQDDLFDQDAENPALILVSSLLRLESEAAFQSLFETDPRFWDVFRDCQKATYEAAAEIDRLQATQEETGDEILNLYAQASSVFRVGGLAVCLKSGEVGDLEAVRQLYDHLAIAGQIVDDLMDLEEDLDRNRHSYAVNKILRTSAESTSRGGNLRQGLVRNLIYGRGSEALIEAIREQLVAARAELEKLELPDEESLVRKFTDGLDQLEQALHRLRVDVVLGPLLQANT